MEKLPLETQTLYAELLERLLAIEARRTIGKAPGGFTTKVVKGETYYYFQYSDPGSVLRQVCLGKRSPMLDKVVAKFESERGEFESDREGIQRLCAQLRAGGALTTDGPRQNTRNSVVRQSAPRSCAFSEVAGIYDYRLPIARKGIGQRLRGILERDCRFLSYGCSVDNGGDMS